MSEDGLKSTNVSEQVKIGEHTSEVRVRVRIQNEQASRNPFGVILVGNTYSTICYHCIDSEFLFKETYIPRIVFKDKRVWLK